MHPCRNLIVAGLTLSVAAGAAVPTFVHYQGRLLETNGAPVNGARMIAIGLHTNPTAGAAVFTQLVGSVTVENGMFEFLFGSASDSFAAALTNDACWVELRVDGVALSPRQRLVAVPYAFHVRNAVLMPAETAAGAGATAADQGAAFGAGAVADTLGAAAGRSASAEFFGAAVGADALAFNAGAAFGYQAWGFNQGVAVGALANGPSTNIAIGARASADGVLRAAIGYAVTNTVNNSTAVRGDLYLDGGTAIRTRPTAGSGAWATYPGGWTGTIVVGAQSLLFTNGVLMKVTP